MIILEAALLAVLFAFSAFFSASEAAITALSSLRMKRLSILQPKMTPYFVEWLSKPHQLLITILVGNSLVNLSISSLTTTMVLPLERYVRLQILEVIVWLAVTGALLIFGEIVPKIVGRAYRERVSLFSLPVLGAVIRFFSPVFVPVNWLIGKLAPQWEAAPVNRLSAVSIEEANFMISEYQATGRVPSDSGEMMKRALTLTQRTVGEIMQKVPDVDSLPLEKLDHGSSAAETFVDLLVETGRTRVPVTRAGKPVGFINVMDLLKKWREGHVESLEKLVRSSRRCASTMRAVDLLTEFQRTGEHLSFVMDGAGRFLGLVTLEDVLEEVVGEILDEYDLVRVRRRAMTSPVEGNT